MPTVISHGVAAVAIQQVLTSERLPPRFWLLSIGCAMLPDVDVAGFSFGIRYGDLLGHRGLTHSLPFALVVACAAAWFALQAAPELTTRWLVLVAYFFVVTASHSILDGMTNGGLGVAFFAPFSNARYFFPWRPIEVSPLGFDFFFSSRALSVLWSEIKWIWVPSAIIVGASQLLWTIRQNHLR
jgi:inner membrane protein